MNEDVTYYLEPGNIFVSTQRELIRTVLGTCVSVCLWDKRNKFGGMNHFLYPETKNKKKATAKYGNVAIFALLKLMKELGSSKKDIVAQIVGGGTQEGMSKNKTSEKNIRIARKILKENKISVISEDVGGKMGRKIFFETDSGHVGVVKVHKLRKEDWLEG